MSIESRQHAAQIFHHALAQSSVERAASAAIRHHGNALQLRDQLIPLDNISQIFIIAIGKAASPLFDAVRRALPAHLSVRAVLSAPAPPKSLSATDQYFAGGHPQPNRESLDAANAALRLLGSANASTLILFLITGGASAMFESPLSPTISLDDLITLNNLLVASGAPIREINCVRKHLSAVKGGRLAIAAANAAAQISLFISDVPTTQLDALASGPTLLDSTTVEECHSILRASDLHASLPPAITALLPHLPETPKHLPQSLAPIILLDNAHLIARAAEHAASLGYEVLIDSSCDDWDATDAAEYLLNRLSTHPHSGKPLCLLSGGEVVVTLPRTAHGTGGRNSHFTLACALQRRAARTNFTVLSAGSDGIDGNAPAAGAIADETTLARANEHALNPQNYFERFDAHSFFHTLGDAIITGPTGNNLRDLRILLRF